MKKPQTHPVKEAKLLLEMVDGSGRVLWSEQPFIVSKGHTVRYGPVEVNYTLEGSGSTAISPQLEVISGKFTGYFKVTVLEMPEEGS
jgi:hypothetical protein